MITSVASGMLNGIQGARLGKQVPDGTVPVETGTQPAPETPPQAARIQKSIPALGTVNIASGVALVAVNGMLAQTDHSRPPLRRALRSTNGNGVSPLTLAAAVSGLAAVADEARAAGDGPRRRARRDRGRRPASFPAASQGRGGGRGRLPRLVIAVFARIGALGAGEERSGRQADQAPSCGRLSCAP